MPLFAITGPDATPAAAHGALAALVEPWRRSSLGASSQAVALVVRLPTRPVDHQLAVLAAFAESRRVLDARPWVRLVWRVDAAGLAAWRAGAARDGLVDGLHLSGGACAALTDVPRPTLPFGVPAHDAEEVGQRLGCAPDWVWISPVRPTPSKAAAAPLSPARLEQLRSRLGRRAVGLGGVDASTLPGLCAAGLGRYAACRAVSTDPRALVSALAACLHPR